MSEMIKNCTGEEMLAIIEKARSEKDLSVLMAQIPYARLIGMEALSLGEEMLFVLPAAESNIGNPTLPALHGGCVGGFMENAALCHVIATTDGERVPKVVDFSLDYLRAGRFRDTYASCKVVRQGRKVVNVAVTAWQTTYQEPIATARTHLLL